MSDTAQSPPLRRTPNTLVVPLTVASGVFMEGFDSTIITTSLPQMASSLGVNPTELSIAITSYLLALATSTLISGWMADRFGARRIFCWAIAIFTIASGFCALADSLGFLVAMRMVQGAAGGMLTPVARLILVKTFPKNQLMTVTNYMVIPALIGPMAGPVVGGFITEYFSWRWIFLINIPIGIIGIFLVLRLVDEVPILRPPRFDVLGFVIIGIGFASAQFWLENIGRDMIGLSAKVAVLFVAVAALALYSRYARSQANPVLDLKLFAMKSFSVSIIWGNIARLGIGGTPFLLPLMLQMAFGLDAFHAGTLMAVASVGALFMRVGGGRVLKTLGLRRSLIVSTFVTAAMLFGFVLINAGTPPWILIPYLFAFGFMRSIQYLNFNMLTYSDLPVEALSRGNTIFTVAQRLSIGMGVAISAILITAFAGADARLAEADFHRAFVVLGVIELVAICGFWKLHPATGREITDG